MLFLCKREKELQHTDEANTYVSACLEALSKFNHALPVGEQLQGLASPSELADLCEQFCFLQKEQQNRHLPFLLSLVWASTYDLGSVGEYL